MARDEYWKKSSFPMAAPRHDSGKLITNDWVIWDFRLRQEEPGRLIASPYFRGGLASCRATWQVHIYPKGRDEKCCRYLSIYLTLEKSTVRSIRASFAFSCLKFHTIVGRRLRSRYPHIFQVGSSFGFRKFVPLSLITAPGSEFLPRGNLTIHTEVTLFEEDMDAVDFHAAQLSRDLGQFVDDPLLSDVTFLVDGTEFKAHKILLTARSPALAALLRYSDDNKIAISDISPDVFRELLCFIYTGKVPNIDDVADKLLVAADKYLLHDLRVMCEKSLYNQLSVENAADTLLLAYHCGVGGHLKSAVIGYVLSNCEEVMNTEGWNNLVMSAEYEALVTEIDERLQGQVTTSCSAEPPPRKKFKGE
ncbi:speckle-type POZ protein B-like [Ornithodoros turicata]|uniref:speckle-type POZ protein B-like n=1 Tax=Ornithodoros turicata TaxID=34597 RepID=UPI003138FA3B